MQVHFGNKATFIRVLYFPSFFIQICKKACNALSTSDFVYVQFHGYNNLTQGNTVDEADIEVNLNH